MSNYGPPPGDPNQQPYGARPGGPPSGPPPGQPPAYGAQPGYGQNPYAPPTGQPYGHPAQPGMSYGVPYAHWGKRVLAYLLDYLLQLPFIVLAAIGGGMIGAGVESTWDPTTGTYTDEGITGLGIAGIVIAGVSYLALFVFTIWNLVIRQGRTGYSLGKQWVGIRLVKEATGQPMGGWMCFVRSLCHILDALPCYLGFLWPLWDAKRQTFADKIMSTIVIDQPRQR